MASEKPKGNTLKKAQDASTRELVFNNAKRIAKVLTQTFGPNTEVAVHDFRDLEHSLIHLEGEITKREIGAPITDLVLKAWRVGGDATEDLANYRTQTGDGHDLKSSTVFLRDGNGTIIGALCINFDITELSNTVSHIQRMIQFHEAPPDHAEMETFASNVLETNEAMMAHAAQTVGKHPAAMDKDEKIHCLTILENNGAFMIKGMVDHVAESMGISKYTVYSYLKRIRSGSKR